MQSNLKFQSLPIANDEQKIEVQLDSEDQIILKLSTWTDGLGWCAQKTMSFDAEMLEDLQRALMVAKNKSNRKKSENEDEIKFGKVIRLPFAA